MSYKSHAIREIKNFSEQFPEYTLGEMLYSTARLLRVTKISDFLNKTDEEIFTAINTAIEEEREDAAV